MKHLAKKRFGQNFLHDEAIITSLINAIAPNENDLMVEIGPGLGAMTQPLLKKLNFLHVVEIDRDIIAWMQKVYPANKIMIHNADVLKFDFLKIGKKIRVVGNLPYNISSPILFKLLENASQIIDMHFMLQKEVVERMVASPSTAAYGRLSVMLQYALSMEYLITVPPEAFDPAPKVESAFVRCIPFNTKPFIALDEKLFAEIVQAAFSQRRKTLRNTLKNFLNDEDFKTLGVDSQLRAENLHVSDFVSIANYLSNRRSDESA
jgi:16S rRNA (adenine1518-N6/adenine1519-N6)-dimethyltransferase